jgi:DNA-3-methyladenine glycosylase
MTPKILLIGFYSRDTAKVARELLGKILVRRLDTKTLKAIIVETEAYYGKDDPASRAYHGKKKYNRVMWEKPGRIFIYNVHQYWMLNIIAHQEEKVGGVLIRAIEPVEGMETMKKNRPGKQLTNLTSGPGKLTQALLIDKNLNGIDATSINSPIYVLENKKRFEIVTSHRIGVTKDLEEKLRFYIKGNPFVSRKKN